MKKKKKNFRWRDPIAKDLRTPKYKKRVVPDKKKKKKLIDIIKDAMKGF